MTEEKDIPAVKRTVEISLGAHKFTANNTTLWIEELSGNESVEIPMSEVKELLPYIQNWLDGGTWGIIEPAPPEWEQPFGLFVPPRPMPRKERHTPRPATTKHHRQQMTQNRKDKGERFSDFLTYDEILNKTLTDLMHGQVPGNYVADDFGEECSRQLAEVSANAAIRWVQSKLFSHEEFYDDKKLHRYLDELLAAEMKPGEESQ